MASDKRNGEVSNMDGWKTGKKKEEKEKDQYVVMASLLY